MLPPDLQTPREVTRYYDALYNGLVNSGNAVPFLYPWAGCAAFLVFGYLLIDHRRSDFLRWLRYPVFVVLCAFQIWVIATNKAKHPAAAFGVGLLSAWGMLYVFVIMIVNDCQADFVRVERATTQQVSKGTGMNGSVKHDTTAGSTDMSSKSSSLDETSDALCWQSFPRAFSDRLDWVADVFCSFRGVGWNYQISGVPPLPKSIQAQLDSKIDATGPSGITVSKSGIRRFKNKAPLLSLSIRKVVIGYLALDVIKTLMHNDAYFLGYIDAAAPSYLPWVVQESYVLLRSYRLLISLAGVYTALWEIYSFGPLFFSGILGPEWIGVRGEAWMNPADMFGSFQSVLDHGLAGWWGGWWHQTFRYAFEAPATKLLKAAGIDKRSEKGKLVSLFLAFFLSGCLHACASYTQLGDTRPLLGPMRFFLLQPLGITSQMLLMRELKRATVLEKLPAWLKQAANFVFVHVWLYYTAPLLMDDFSKGGVWYVDSFTKLSNLDTNFVSRLFEPIAISPLRALGLGAKDETWFCWWNGILFWRRGSHWWDTGLAL